MVEKQMSDRLYGFRPAGSLPFEVKEMGHNYQLSRILIQGGGREVLLLLPGADDLNAGDVWYIKPDEHEWAAIVQASDDPQYYDQIGKIWLRKAQRLISGKVQQIIWARDGFKCMYCGKKMGDVQLTVDHFMPLDEGGQNDETNYLSSCRKCNKDKGNMQPRDWCRIKRLDYDDLSEYLLSQ